MGKTYAAGGLPDREVHGLMALIFLEMLVSILECPVEPWWLPFLLVGSPCEVETVRPGLSYLVCTTLPCGFLCLFCCSKARETEERHHCPSVAMIDPFFKGLAKIISYNYNLDS